MDEIIVRGLRELGEPMATLSIAHLSASTRRKLADNNLSVNAHLQIRHLASE